MQRSDVLTGLSIRLGPALKIYEHHVKVLQKTHFLEYEDLWSCDSPDRQTVLLWPKNACSVLFHLGPASFVSTTCRRWAGGWEYGGGSNVHCENDQKLKDVVLPLIMAFSFQMVFHFTHVAVWLHCEGHQVLRSVFKLEEQWPFRRS